VSDAATKTTLANIEALLVGERANPREALEAAYQLGRLDGMMEMALLAEKTVNEIAKAVA